jgi:hypothetical protein
MGSEANTVTIAVFSPLFLLVTGAALLSRAS